MFEIDHNNMYRPLDMVTCRMCADMGESWVHCIYPSTRGSEEAGPPRK